MTILPIVAENKSDYSFEDRVEERAKEMGCEIVYAKEDEIQIDIDTDEALVELQAKYDEMQERLRYFNSLFP